MNPLTYTTFLSAPLIALMLAAPAQAVDLYKAGDGMVRLRATGIVTSNEDSHVSIGGTVDVDNTIIPELDFSYFFSPTLSVELVTLIAPLDVKTSGGVDAGETWVLPPTLTLKYHFTQLDYVEPYVGAGVNYTHFFNEDGGALNSANYQDSFGPVLQAGADMALDGNWIANIDVKKVFLDTTAKFSPSGVRADVDVEPWLFSVGVGYKF